MEDKNTLISLEEALMWATCTSLSPLSSGMTINPY